MCRIPRYYTGTEMQCKSLGSSKNRMFACSSRNSFFDWFTIEEYQRSPEGREPLVSLQLVNKKTEDMEQNTGKPEEENVQIVVQHPVYVTSAFSEICVLSSRNFMNVIRTPELFFSRIGMMVAVALTMGTLFLQVKVDEKGIRQRTSFISFTLALLIFTSVEAMGVFLEEHQIFIRETSRGAYRAATYVISEALVILPFLMVLAIVYSSIAYFLVGFVAEAGAFFFFTFTVFHVLLVSNSFVSFVSGLKNSIVFFLRFRCPSRSLPSLCP